MASAVELLGMGQELDRDAMRERRKALNLSQSEAAELAGFPGGASQWSDIESKDGRRANVTIATLDKIAMTLKCDVRDLITPLKPKRPAPRRKR